MAKGDQFLLPKLVRLDRLWQQKWSGGTNFGKIVCQNWSGQTHSRGDQFWCDMPTLLKNLLLVYHKTMQLLLVYYMIEKIFSKNF